MVQQQVPGFIVGQNRELQPPIIASVNETPIVSSPVTLDFTITRHAHSCNNLKEGKASANMKGTFLKDYNFFDRTFEHDPGLSFYGVIASILKTANVSDDRYKSDTVFVSCLVRTWMTAILLYLKNITSDTLTLVISPYLKEKHVSLNLATAPAVGLASFFKSWKKMAIGNTSTMTYPWNGLWTIDGGNLPKDIGEQIIMLIHFFKNLSVIFLYLDKKDRSENENETKIHDVLNNFIGKKIKLVIPNGESNFEITIPLSDDISLDYQKLIDLNRTIFSEEIKKFYFFYTAFPPGFPRNSPTKTILEILTTKYKTLDTLDKIPKTDIDSNIIGYFEKLIEKEFTDAEIVDTVFEDDNSEDDDNYDIDYIDDDKLPEENKIITEANISESLTSVEIPETTKQFLTKDINQFIRWVKDYSQRNSIPKIHAVTHSDCMQTFCSQMQGSCPEKIGVNEQGICNSVSTGDKYGLLFDNKTPVIIPSVFPKSKRTLTQTVVSTTSLGIFGTPEQEQMRIDNKKANKKFNLKSQNSWDLKFNAEIEDKQSTLSHIQAFKGPIKPKNIGNLISACERNCNFGYGVGSLVTEGRNSECTSALLGNSKNYRRLQNFSRSFGFGKRKGGKRTRKNKKPSKTHRKRRNNKHKSRK